MPKHFQDIRIGLDESLEEKLKLLSPGYSEFRLLRKSVDARGKAPRWVMSLDTYQPGETPPTLTYEVKKAPVSPSLPPILIIGAGPAGLFAGLRLIERGFRCILFEQGSAAPERMRQIANYWRYGKLNPLNNVCFGEGGAGLYSDGKLITRIKSPHIPYVLNRLVRFGAPSEIEYLANPHVGSDKIRKVIPPFREYLKAHGCEVRFDTKVKKILFEGEKTKGVELADGTRVEGAAVVLATGHSATDMLEHLFQSGVAMEGKSFAVGLRIEHPQKQINSMQYGDYAGHPSLGAANYRLTDHDESTGIGVYSFCMCPGGFVIASSTEQDGVVSNGMSNYARNSAFANAALVVSMDHQALFGSNVMAGLKYRRDLEVRARRLVEESGGDRQFPVQTVEDFIQGKAGRALPSSSPSGVVATRLDTFFDESVYRRICKSLAVFDRKMPGFLSSQAQFHGVESRTSCPVRVIRDDASLQSISHPGLFPCGEGAGYAGGITSAAVDGVRVAEAVLCHFAAIPASPAVQEL